VKNFKKRELQFFCKHFIGMLSIFYSPKQISIRIKTIWHNMLAAVPSLVFLVPTGVKLIYCKTETSFSVRSSTAESG
jgi:hypothetical protein